MSQNEKKQYDSLTPEEKKVYDALLEHYPASSPDAAYDAAIQGGVRWQFHFK